MKLPSKDLQILQHILKYAYQVDTMLRELHIKKEDFQQNFAYRNAISMSLLQIGECVKKLSKDFRERNPEIPWRAIAGMRDFFAHEYGKMNVDMLWDAAANDLPQVQMFCERKLRESNVPLPKPEPLVDTNQ